MLNCAEQVQIQKCKIHAIKTPKTADVQTIMLKHPTKQQKKKKKPQKKTKKRKPNNNKNVSSCLFKILTKFKSFSPVINHTQSCRFLGGENQGSESSVQKRWRVMTCPHASRGWDCNTRWLYPWRTQNLTMCWT